MIQRSPEHYQEKSGTEMLLERMNEKQFEAWHERAAIIEYSANMSRADAEWLAAVDVLRDILPNRTGG